MFREIIGKILGIIGALLKKKKFLNALDHTEHHVGIVNATNTS